MIRSTLILCAGIIAGYLIALLTLLGPRETLACLELTVRGYDVEDLAPPDRAAIITIPPLVPADEPTPTIEPFLPVASFHFYADAVEDDGRPGEEDAEPRESRLTATLGGFRFPNRCPNDGGADHPLLFRGSRTTTSDGFFQVGYGFMTCEECASTWIVTWAEGSDPVLHLLAGD